MTFVCYNGKFLPADQALFNAQNRGWRYGDGVFETMKWIEDRVMLEPFHFDRLFLGLRLLQMQDPPDAAYISELVRDLCRKNECVKTARVRLAVFRNDDNESEFVIETSPLHEEVNRWVPKGLTVDVYPYSRKAADAFSNLKTANFLPYVMAERFASERGLDDAIVLNSYNCICDSSRANIFLIKGDKIITPALHQGCVSGVIRRYLVDQLKKQGIHVYQQEVSVAHLQEADEVFLTNSIQEMRWVASFRGRNYSCEKTRSIYSQVVEILYERAKN